MKRRVMTGKDTESDFSNQWNAKYYFPLNGDSYECVNGVLGELKKQCTMEKTIAFLQEINLRIL